MIIIPRSKIESMELPPPIHTQWNPGMPEEVADTYFPSETATGLYKVIRVIGRGAFSTSLLVEQPDTSTQYALKIVHLNKLIAAGITASTTESVAISEALKIQRLEHPNIIKCFSSWSKTFSPTDKTVVLKLNYCQGGTLSEKIADRTQEIQTRKWIGQILEALNYAHTQVPRIIHGDFKPENICLTETGNIQVIDWMSSVTLFSTATRVGTTTATHGPAPLMGTQMYMSPERTSGRSYFWHDDIWAAGLVFLQLVLRRPIHELMGTAIPADFPEELTPLISEAKRIDNTVGEIIENCLKENMRERKPAASLLEMLRTPIPTTPAEAPAREHTTEPVYLRVSVPEHTGTPALTVITHVEASAPPPSVITPAPATEVVLTYTPAPVPSDYDRQFINERYGAIKKYDNLWTYKFKWRIFPEYAGYGMRDLSGTNPFPKIKPENPKQYKDFNGLNVRFPYLDEIYHIGMAPCMRIYEFTTPRKRTVGALFEALEYLDRPANLRTEHNTLENQIEYIEESIRKSGFNHLADVLMFYIERHRREGKRSIYKFKFDAFRQPEYAGYPPDYCGIFNMSHVCWIGIEDKRVRDAIIKDADGLTVRQLRMFPLEIIEAIDNEVKAFTQPTSGSSFEEEIRKIKDMYWGKQKIYKNEIDNYTPFSHEIFKRGLLH